MEVLSLVWAGLVWELVWESPFREDSGLPTLALAFALRLYSFTLQGYRCAGTRSTAVSSTLKIRMRNFRILFSTPFSHFLHFIMLLLLCYGAHLVFWSGTVSSRNTRRAEHPAEARQKLRESSAHLQLCSKLQGAVVVIPSKKNYVHSRKTGKLRYSRP